MNNLVFIACVELGFVIAMVPITIAILIEGELQRRKYAGKV